MDDIFPSVIRAIRFENILFWEILLGATLLVWMGIRAFLDDSRLRRALSVAVPLVPALLAAANVAFDWNHVRRSLTFNRPEYLGLLALVPLVVWFSLKSLAGLGAVRQTMSIALRSVILILVIAALAEAQFVRFAERLAVIFCIDYSRSIPKEREGWIRDYVDKLIQTHKPGTDLAGVIYFGKTPRIEIPPLPYVEPREPEGEYDRDHTDVGAALKLAQAAFPEGTMKRIFLISDGNENRGEALREAVAAKANGVSIDVMPVHFRYDNEVVVEKATMPAETQKGETVNLNIVVRSNHATAGILRLFQRANNRVDPIDELAVELKRGVNVFNRELTLQEANFYTYEAKFQPANLAEDRIAANNQAQTFTYLKGSAKVMLIEGQPGEHAALIEALRQEEIEVEVRGPDQIPDELTALRPYDLVILANLPREDLSDRQMEMLAANTHDLGAGLMMIGGSESFGAGGYIDTPIEKAMPVDMQIKSLKVTGKGALVLIMHGCEIPQGNYWEKVIAKDAIKTLSYNDEAGCLQAQGTSSWVFPLQEVKDKTHLLRRIDRMTPQDAMDFDSLLKPARDALKKSDASTKHCIIITDGDPAAPSPGLIESFKLAKITVSTVGVAVHGGDTMGQGTLRRIATRTGGKCYIVKNNKELPKIFQKEARVVSRPLLFEQAAGWKPNIVVPTDPIAGLSSAALPPIKGIVLTTAKQNELVDVPITSPEPKGSNNPLLAHWQFGLGKAVAFTSDAGYKWATDWTGWENYRRFWAQLVRWSMRSVESSNIAVSTQVGNGKIKIIADVLDKDNEFVDFAKISGVVLDPNMKRHNVELVQTRPGYYEATLEEAETAGTYFVTMEARLPGQDPSSFSTGVNVPYPAEYRELESNPGLLEQLASVTGGHVVQEENAMRFDAEDNPFRHDLPPPTATQDIWHLLVFAAVSLFLFDVAVRRIAIDLSATRPALAAAWAYVRGRQIEAAPVDYMNKLRARKAEVGRQLDEARSKRRFEPAADAPVAGPSVIEESAAASGPARPSKPVTQPQVTPDAPKEQETYTSRLLKAKQKVWEEKKQD